MPETRAYVNQLKDEQPENAFSLETSTAMEATSQEALEKERVEAARVSALKRKLCEFYPEKLVDFAVERLGRMSEDKFSGIIKNMFSALWNPLSIEEQTKLLEDAAK